MTDRESVSRLAVAFGMMFGFVVWTPQAIGQDDAANMQGEISYGAMPQVEQGRFFLPALSAPSIATDAIGNGRIPDGFRGGEETPAFVLPESASQRAEVWNWTVCSWAAPNTFSNPRYFEDRMLERHGHQRFGKWQPFASGARFFSTVPMLPYLMAISDPCDCEYTLGYYRPGSCTPGFLQRPPYDRRALIAESAAVAGAMIAFP